MQKSSNQFKIKIRKREKKIMAGLVKYLNFKKQLTLVISLLDILNFIIVKITLLLHYELENK